MSVMTRALILTIANGCVDCVKELKRAPKRGKKAPVSPAPSNRTVIPEDAMTNNRGDKGAATEERSQVLPPDFMKMVCVESESSKFRTI